MLKRKAGVRAALLSAGFFGLTPIFGKLAVNFGISPLAVVGFRTIMATLLLLLLTAIINRKYLYIYPAGLIGCGLAGLLNGVGSIFYYAALDRISAGIGQLLYSLYPLFVAIILFFDSQPPSRLTLIRIFLALLAIVFLTNASSGTVDVIGILQMLVASVLYAAHLPVNQRVLYDIPAPTVTLYTLCSMSLVVFPAFLLFDRTVPEAGTWWPILGLTLVTFLARLTLFFGVKHLGGMQTALLGLMELLVTLGLSIVWLKETLTSSQWIGAVILFLSMLLVYFEKPPTTRTPNRGGWLGWLTPPQPPELRQ
ncbi:MAG: DMT family transporter [Anaerolineales bacterium]